MGTSQRVGRGFHRLAVFMAAIPFLVGAVWSVSIAFEQADRAELAHAERVALFCAKLWFRRPKETSQPSPFDDLIRDPQAKGLQPRSPEETDAFMARIVGHRYVDLRDLGCSEGPNSVALKDVFLATEPPQFPRASALLPPLAIGLAVTLAMSLAVYGLVRAIGWVIGGFAAT